jgi:hypothetical protein
MMKSHSFALQVAYHIELDPVRLYWYIGDRSSRLSTPKKRRLIKVD